MYKRQIEDPAKRKRAFDLMETLIAKLKDKTFCERSLSGKGSHIWGRFTLNKGKVQNREIGLEIFAYNQQVIPTGDVLGESTDLANIQSEVDELLTLINQPPAVKAAPAKPPPANGGNGNWVDGINLSDGNRNIELNNTVLWAVQNGREDDVPAIIARARAAGLPQKEIDATVASASKAARTIAPPVDRIVSKNTNADTNTDDWELVATDQLNEYPEGAQAWLFEPLTIRDEQVTLLYSREKQGKSTLTRQMIGAMIRGEDFLGHTPEKFCCPWLGEEAEPHMKDEIKRWVKTDSDLLVAVRNPRISDTKTFFRRLMSAVDQLKAKHKLPVLVVIDTLSWLTNQLAQNQNDSGEAGKIAEMIVRCGRTRFATLILHHEVKSSESTEARGSTAITAAVDMMVRFQRFDNTGKIQVERAGRGFYGKMKEAWVWNDEQKAYSCLLYTSPSPRD